MWVYLYTGTPTPVWADLVYDFSVSDWGWIGNNSATAWNINSNGAWWRMGNWSDWRIQAPSGMFSSTPSIVAITYELSTGGGTTQSWGGTWVLQSDAGSVNRILCPSEYNSLQWMMAYGASGNPTYTSMWADLVWNHTWYMYVDKSGSTRNVDHTITDCPNTFTDTTWALQNIWNTEQLRIRLVNRGGNTWSALIKKVEVWF